MMNCPTCGHENPDEAKFCMECGAAAGPKTCAQCGRDLPEGAKFCLQCGARVAADQVAAADPAAPTLALPVSFVSGRYRVLRLLGRGGRKKVYLARDERLGREVAFAVIAAEGLSPGEKERALREAQVMARLGSDPHLVSIFDIGEDDGSLFTVQEFMPGGDVARLLDESPEHRPPVARTLAIATDVCRALESIHAAGIVHRDLKPANVFLAADGSARVGDLGLAATAGLDRITQHGTMVGTVAYMAPEQALGSEVSPASDLYSFGCLLYEMVTGRPPFQGDDPTAVISQHINTQPVAPSWLTEHCPPDLEGLILGLLAKDPAERPASAREVLDVLGRVDPEAKSASHSGSANPLDRLARGVFVGREGELEMLVGEPGIGKTRTAQELETYARMRGAHVFWGRTHESSGAPAYWPWVQVGTAWGAAVDLLGTGGDVLLTGNSLAPGTSELVRLFPALRQLPGFVEPEPIGEPETAQFRLFDAYATFMRNQSSERPWLVILDDLHWADKPTLQLLQFVARELPNMRVLVVGTYRDTELARTHPLSEALAELNREIGFLRIPLRGLTRDEVGDYIRQRAAKEPPREVVDRIFDETEGNAFFLSEVVNLMAEEGTLDKDSVSDIALPEGVREALGRRLDRLSDAANDLLQVCAIVGREFTYDTLTLLGQRSDDELLRLIEEGLAARVIEEAETPGRYRFTHALMQETLLGELSTTRKVRLHGQVGEALEKRYGANADARAARLALHFSESATLTPGHSERAVRFSRLAGEQAEAEYAWDQAARHYERCLELLAQAGSGPAAEEEEAPLLEALGRCDVTAQRFRPGWRSLMGAIDRYREVGDWTGMARCTLMASDGWVRPERALQLVEEALAAPGERDARLEAQLLARRAGNHLCLADERERDLVRAREKGANFAEVLAAITHAEADMAFEHLQLEDARQLYLDAALRTRECGKPAMGAFHLWAAGWITAAMRGLGEARAIAEEALVRGREVRARYAEANALALLATYALLASDMDRARALHREIPPGTFMTEVVGVLIAEREGALDLDRLALPDPSLIGGVPAYAVLIHASRARALYMAGEMERAREEIEHAARFVSYPRPYADRVGHLSLAGPAFPALADESFVRTVHETLSGADPYRWFFLASLDRFRGLLALRLDRLDEAERHFRTGADWCEREGCPVELGLQLQGLAAVAERHGNSDEALKHLDRAGELFRRHGARLYLNQVVEAKVRLQGIGDTQSSIAAVTSAVQHERPDISAHAAPDGTVTLMFSDIEGSTTLNEQLGDAKWMEVLHAHNALVEEQVRERGGRVVKTIGDGYMVVFQSPDAGVRCALGIQAALASPPALLDGVRVRMGLHVGEAVKEGGDFFGREVTYAARVASAAVGGEVLVSEALHSRCPADTYSFDASRVVALKGFDGTHSVYPVTQAHDIDQQR
jgi:eukaryotic-like serine/threonine-protein kinase